MYNVIKKNGEFNNNIFDDSLELLRSELKIYIIVKGMLSFRFGETDSSKQIQEDFMYNNKLTVTVTKWNKSKILEQLKKADTKYKEIYLKLNQAREVILRKYHLNKINK